MLDQENQSVFSKRHYRQLFSFLFFCMFILIALVYAFFCDCNFIVHAEDNTQTQVAPSGYMFFDEYITNFKVEDLCNLEDFQEAVDTSGYPSDCHYPYLNKDNSVISPDMFDHDLDNGELLVNENINSSKNYYEPVYNDNNIVTRWDTVQRTFSYSTYYLQYDYVRSKYVLLLSENTPDEACMYKASNGDSMTCLIDSAYLTGGGRERFYPYLSGVSNVVQGFSNVYSIDFPQTWVSYPSTTNFGNITNNVPTDVLLSMPMTTSLLASNSSNLFTTSVSERDTNNNNYQDLTILDGNTTEGTYTSEIYGNPSYSIYYSKSNGEDSDTFPDGSGGTDSNNLFLDDPDFVFKHKNYYPPYSSVINSGDHIPDGTITFTGLPNDYQVANAEHFDLVLSFSLSFDVNYRNTHDADIGPFKRTSQLLGNQKNLEMNFVSAEYEFPFSDFISNGNSQSITFKEVFDNLSSHGYDLSGLLAQMREVTEVEYNVFDLYCTAKLVAQGASSGSYSEYYNPINKKGHETDDSMKENKNPYLPSPDDQGGDDPESSNTKPNYVVPGGGGTNGGNSSATATTGSITITNNNTNNYNPTTTINSDKNPISNLIDNLFGHGTVNEGSIGGNTVDKLGGITGGNNFIQYINQTMTWIPASVWAEITIFVGICLGILVAAFILRIVLDFL